MKYVIVTLDPQEARLVDSLEGQDTEEKIVHEVADSFVWGSHSVDWVSGALNEDLSSIELALHNQIDREAGEFRLRFITDIPGQQATYLDKEKEARAWTQGADPSGFPRLSAEATVRNIALADMVTLILTTADQWRALDVHIEATRISAKLAVTAAITEEDKRAAAVVNWEALLV